MTIAEKVLACLREARESDREIARRENRSDWEGWCDLARVRRWLAAAGDFPQGDTVRRALGRLVRDGSVEAGDVRWRAVA